MRPLVVFAGLDTKGYPAINGKKQTW